MKHFFSVLFALAIGMTSKAQTITPELLGFQAFNLYEKELGEVTYYLSRDTTTVKKPLLVYLDGSGALPLFQKVQNGIGSTVVIDFQKLKNNYRILLISKPGVPFADELSSDENGFPLYEAPETYTNKLSLDWRVNSAHSIINKLISQDVIDSTKIVVFGFSEGAQVGPMLASKNKKLPIFCYLVAMDSINFLTPLFRQE